MTKNVWTRSVIKELDSLEYGVTAPEYNPWLWLICYHYHLSPNLARFLQASSLVREPLVPKPSLESAHLQPFSLLPIIPILALDLSYLELRILNPSL